jgi:hypothetical protein
MPPRKTTTEHQQELELEPSRPRTRSKNANQHPGVDAVKRLQVRRDPEVIQKEKEERKRKKEEKEREREEEEARKEASARLVEEYRAQQAVDMAKQEASIPRRRSQGMEYFLFPA